MANDVGAIPQPLGDGTGYGGGDGGGPHAHIVGGRKNGGPSTQDILALNPNMTQNMSHQQAHALNVMQLEFARDNATRTAAAYQKMLDILGHPTTPTVAAG